MFLGDRFLLFPDKSKCGIFPKSSGALHFKWGCILQEKNVFFGKYFKVLKLGALSLVVSIE